MNMNQVTDCYECKHRRNVPGNAYIQCVKPDLLMTGSEHGIRNGWFDYPWLFDPIWKTKECDHWEAKGGE